jgi:prepilin-type N-terminal cleavage/methylation domain-containing protein
MRASTRTTPSRCTRAACARAFTLVELIVGISILAIISGAAAASMHRLVNARAHAVARRQAFARASDAAARIALDAASASRDATLFSATVRVTSAGTPQTPRDELLVLCGSTRPVRGTGGAGDTPEGDAYEVQYRVEGEAGQGWLWRRADPALDSYLDAGGVASPIIPGVRSMSVQAYDGRRWLESWDSDEDGMPHALRIVITAQSDKGEQVATARRVVPIDRVPLVPKSEESQSEDSSDSSSSTPASGGGGGQ